MLVGNERFYKRGKSCRELSLIQQRELFAWTRETAEGRGHLGTDFDHFQHLDCGEELGGRFGYASFSPSMIFFVGLPGSISGGK